MNRDIHIARIFASLGLAFAVLGMILYLATTVSSSIVIAPFIAAMVLSAGVFVIVNHQKI